MLKYNGIDHADFRIKAIISLGFNYSMNDRNMLAFTCIFTL